MFSYGISRGREAARSDGGNRHLMFSYGISRGREAAWSDGGNRHLMFSYGISRGREAARSDGGKASLDVLSYEITRGIECLVEDFEQTMALALENHQSSVRNELDLLFKQLETREWIAVAAEKQCRAANLAPVLGPQLVGEARTVQRIRKKDQPAEVRIDRGHARNPSTEGLTTTDDVMSSTRGLDEDRHRARSATARKIDSDRIDSSSFETHDVGFHRRCGARCSMSEDDSHDVYRRSLEEVEHHHHHDVIRKNFHNPLEKKSSRGLT